MFSLKIKSDLRQTRLAVGIINAGDEWIVDKPGVHRQTSPFSA